MRSGTHNVAGIVGLGAAAHGGGDRTGPRPRPGCGRCATTWPSGCGPPSPDAIETGRRRAECPGHLHLRFPGIESEALLVLLDEAGVCASAGAACASGAMEPSPVLLAMGVPKEEALSSLRLTLGPTTTAAEVDLAATAVPAAVARLREA